jgi:Fe-S oxidoreductase
MIYFRGCVAREKLQKVAMATEEILKEAGIDYQLLDNEGCCGSVLLRTGFQEDALKIMLETLKDIGEEKVLVSCAGCYRAFKKDYPEILGKEVDVVHTSQLFADLIKEGKIQPHVTEERVTYHDPCHLGRHMGEYQAPRQVLEETAILVEMDRNRQRSRCCGAGGGVKSAFPETSHKIARMRLEDAEKTGAELLVTCCPFCILNLQSAEEDGKVSSRVQFSTAGEDSVDVVAIAADEDVVDVVAIAADEDVVDVVATADVVRGTNVGLVKDGEITGKRMRIIDLSQFLQNRLEMKLTKRLGTEVDKEVGT